MEFYGVTFKNVRPYAISGKDVTSCDIYIGNVFAARYVLVPSKNGGEPKATISYAGEEARAEMHATVKEALGTLDVMEFLNRAFDLYEYEFTMESLQQSGCAEGLMLIFDKGNMAHPKAVAALRKADAETVRKAKSMFGYMGRISTNVCTCSEDFVVA